MPTTNRKRLTVEAQAVMSAAIQQAAEAMQVPATIAVYDHREKVFLYDEPVIKEA